jgi:hypothetical protein
MIDRLPTNRDDLVNLYSSNDSSISKNSFLDLDPSVCAKSRDLASFSKKPFTSGSVIDDAGIVKLGDHVFTWVLPSSGEEYFEAVELKDFSFKKPCDKRIKFIEKKVNGLIDLYPQEIKFITDFTSTIVWLQPGGETFLGSAAFYEIPHCTFFSDLAMFSIPPEIVVPKQHAGYAILENLYHEALHHQMHTYSVLVTGGYLHDEANQSLEIDFPWRNKTFTLLEALHALHVYSLVTPMRLKFLNKLFAENDIERLEWAQRSFDDGLKMWGGLCNKLMTYSSEFKDLWLSIIKLWDSQFYEFSLNYRTPNEFKLSLTNNLTIGADFSN